MKTNLFITPVIFMLLILFQYQNPAYGQCNELVWADEFDSPGLPDPTKWSFETGGSGWGNNELEYYTENRQENARVADGKLTIEARLEPYGGRDYTSARLVSKQKGDWLYGRIEVKAKLPSGRGTWPAIWMMPTDAAYGGWPASGEIDIMEHVGYDPNVVHASIHTDAFNWPDGTQKTSTTTVPDVFNTFHVYVLDWTPEKMDVYVDNIKYFTFVSGPNYREWPFNKSFFLILNIAVGGNWGGVQGIDNSIFPAKMEIDYVRVYQSSGNLKVFGPSGVTAKQKGIRYHVMSEESRTYAWQVPVDATLVSGQGTHEIVVDWGCTEGSVQCHLDTDCDAYDLEIPVAVVPYSVSGPFFVTDNQQGIRLTGPSITGSVMNWMLPDDASIVSGQDNDTLELNWGTGADTVFLHIENTCGTWDIVRLMRYYGQFAYPYPDRPHLIPGTISPENYDYGGEGIAYHDATLGNAGTGPRSDESVDTEVSGNAVDVGWIDANEWLEYSIIVPTGGSYFFNCLTASQNLTNIGPLAVKVNNTIRIPSIEIVNTGSWSTFWPTAFYTIQLNPGDTLLRLESGKGGFNLGMISILEELPSGTNLPAADNLIVYPVPAVTGIYIHNPDGIRGVRIVDLSGRIYFASGMFSGKIKDYEVDVRNFPPGIYLLSVTNDKNITVVRKISRIK